MRYGKIFERFFESTIVDQDLPVRYVFMSLIILSDENGIIDKTPEAIARLINLPIRQVKAALDVLEAPDPNSRNPESEGRRIVRVDEHRDWGWIVVSKEIYRDMRDPEEEREKARERKRKQREREKETREKPSAGHADVTPGHTASRDVRHSDSDRDSDTDSPPIVPPAGGRESGEKRASRKTGTRIPDDFQITDEMRTWGAKNVPGIDLEFETAEFIDYWRARTKDPNRLDWPATWRNRMRALWKERRAQVGARASPAASLPLSFQAFDDDE